MLCKIGCVGKGIFSANILHICFFMSLACGNDMAQIISPNSKHPSCTERLKFAPSLSTSDPSAPSGDSLNQQVLVVLIIVLAVQMRFVDGWHC